MARTMVASPLSSSDDPLSLALRPPPDETPAQKALRLQQEALAKQRSDAIDLEIEKERKMRKAQGKVSGGGGGGGKGGAGLVKVLLLGQSESGKSTTLKNFQLTYAPQAWAAEKLAWRAVILLNLVRAINNVCDAVRRELERENGEQAAPGGLEDVFEAEAEDGEGADDDPNGHRILPSPSDNSPPTSPSLSPITFPTALPGNLASRTSSFPIHVSLPTLSAPSHPLTSQHAELVARLESLRSVQKELERRLGAGSGEEGVDGLPSVEMHSHRGANASNSRHGPQRRPQEFFVRSTSWKKFALAHARGAVASMKPRLSIGSRRSAPGRGDDEKEREEAEGDDDWIEDVVREVVKRRDGMRSLWAERAVRECVRRRKVWLGECGEFFLKDINRIAKTDYMPSDDDIVRARLRTIGVQEHRLVFENGAEAGTEWIIYDVGGSRSLRAQWPSFFDTVNAIIFLAPISAFDEYLLESPSTNRLDDTFQLWKLVCSNKLLQKTELILFLNKIDILRRKLESGVRFAEWVTSYENVGGKDGKERRENEASAVGKYLKGKFSDVFRQHASSQRGLHVHFTSVVDTKATALTLAAVQDGIIRGHLRGMSLI